MIKTKEITEFLKHTNTTLVHLTADNKITHCGVSVTAIVPYKNFSERPCACCIKKKMEQ